VLISLLQIFPNSYLYRHRRYFKIRLQKKGVPYLISSLSWKNTQLRNIYLWLNNYSKTSNLNIKGIEGGWTIEKAKQ
ncbi:MAG: hypothetical protein N3B13_11715, partial [Deltaproteobacteria bacterium]|nr:hypothetical protein [Deltaproteobacteria bacterium]